jgi:hypothetical protein
MTKVIPFDVNDNEGDIAMADPDDLAGAGHSNLELAFKKYFFHEQIMGEPCDERIAWARMKSLTRPVYSKKLELSDDAYKAWCLSLIEHLESSGLEVTWSLQLHDLVWWRLAWQFWIKGQRINKEVVRNYTDWRDRSKEKGFALIIPEPVRKRFDDGILKIQDLIRRADCFELDRFLLTETIEGLYNKSWCIHYCGPEQGHLTVTKAEPAKSDSTRKRSRIEAVGKNLVADLDRVLENAVKEKLLGLKVNHDPYGDRTHEYSGKRNDLLKDLRADYGNELRERGDEGLLKALSIRVEWLKP